MPSSDTTLFEEAIDVPLWLEADRTTPYAERARRERAIARELGAANPLAQVRGWWRSLAPRDAAGPGARLDRLRGLVTFVMIVVGVLAGTSLALAAFRYDGSQPVNVVRLLALVVGLQLLLLLLSLLLIPGRIPGLRGLQELLAAMNPGAWAASLLTRFSPTQSIRNPFDRGAPIGAARFAKWQVLVWSQIAAVGFNVGALGTAIALVTFTDLAFGWSTTLSVDAADVAEIVRAIAWPWHSVVPNAVPDADLVEQSQFFRLDAGGGRLSVPADSRALAGWWPFTLCAIVVYGLLPRVALLVLAATRLGTATRDLLLGDPRVTALLDRMKAPAIETEAAGHDEMPLPDRAPARGLDRALGGPVDAIVWEGSVTRDGARLEARRRFGVEVEGVLEAGGARGLEADRKTVERLERGADRTVLVFTPAWEPPVLEVIDFLRAVRDRVGHDVSIVVVPVPDGQREMTGVELETWQRGVGQLKDSHLYVEVGAR